MRPLLEKYAAGLDTLYGKTYTAYLSKSKNGEFISRQGFDSTEIPAVDAAWQIEDFDQDGNEELLVISVNDDSTLTLTMFEVTEGDRISAADTFDAAVKLNDSIYHVYAAEQGGGYTSVSFLMLPPYSPDLNPIEQVWRTTRKENTHNTFFASLKKLTDTVDNAFEAWAVPNEQLKTLCSFK